jgi:hypothetical protein
MIRYLPIDMATEGVGCHSGKGEGGAGFEKKERKERTSEVTVRPEIIVINRTVCRWSCGNSGSSLLKF